MQAATTPSDEGNVLSGTTATGAPPVRARNVRKQAIGTAADAEQDQLDSALALTAHAAAEWSRRQEWRRTAASRPAQPTVSIVIPTLNEAANLPYILPQLRMYADELVLVDGRSTDETLETARRLCSDIQIVMQEGVGKGAALRRQRSCTPERRLRVPRETSS